MGQGGALGHAGGAGGVLDVDGIVRVQLLAHRVQIQDRVVGQLVPALGAEKDRLLVVVAAELAFRSVDHRAVVRVLEAARGEQALHAGLAHGVDQLLVAVGRVDADQNRTDLGGGELHQSPLPAVGRPDADAVALAVAGGVQAGSQALHLAVELRVRQVYVTVEVDDRVVIRVLGHDAGEALADGLVQQVHVGTSNLVRQGGVQIRRVGNNNRAVVASRGSHGYQPFRGKGILR